MNQYPGQRRDKGSGGRKQQQRRTGQGSSWKDQEDALFGPSPSQSPPPFNKISSTGIAGNRPRPTSVPPSAYCQPCDSSDGTSAHGDVSSKTTGLRKFGSQGGKKLSAMTGQASSKISGILSNVKNSAVTAAAQLDDNIRRSNATSARQQELQQQQQQRQQEGRYEYPAEKQTKIPTSANAISTFNPSSSPPSFSFSFNTPSDHKKDVSRMVQNAVLSQIPMRCTHCHSVPLLFQMHPFFGSQRVCNTHPLSSIPRCVSCDRFQPKNQSYARIGTSSALICNACSRTAILDDQAATKIYKEILVFMSSLGLDLFDGKMERIPIKLADEDTLNQKSLGTDCGATERKRGLCYWSEQHLGIPNVVGAARDMFRRRTGDNSSGSGTDQVRRNYMAGIRHVRVQYILCLKGVPRNLMAGILAHEATHAWFSLNPLRRDGVVGERTFVGDVRRIDQTVEEGTCQLVSHIYLQYIMALDKHGNGWGNKSSKDGGGRKGVFRNLLGNGNGPNDAKLIQYFKWSIENHSSPVYGGGFKLAVKAYEQTVENGGSLKDLLEYISIHRAFPPPLT